MTTRCLKSFQFPNYIETIVNSAIYIDLMISNAVKDAGDMKTTQRRNSRVFLGKKKAVS